MGKIILEGMEFYAFHGYYEQERKVGGTYVIDLELHTDISKAALSDNLSDTVNYGVVYSILKEEMHIPSKLIEHVAGRINDRLLKEFKEIERLKIRVCKINPPVGGKIHSVSVEMEKER